MTSNAVLLNVVRILNTMDALLYYVDCFNGLSKLETCDLDDLFRSKVYVTQFVWFWA